MQKISGPVAFATAQLSKDDKGSQLRCLIISADDCQAHSGLPEQSEQYIFKLILGYKARGRDGRK